MRRPAAATSTPSSPRCRARRPPRHFAGRHRQRLLRRNAGPGGAKLRPSPARHLPQELRSIRRDPRHSRSHQARPSTAATPHAAAFAHRAEFGVPRPVLVAIWGLETDYGTGDIGKLPVIRMVATMAHDCRRTELFQARAARRAKDRQRGDLQLRDLIGAYAGEIGQTQFLPSSYIKYGGRLRRQRPCRSAPQRTGRARLDRQFAEGQRLATGAPYGEGDSKFRGDARVEPRRGLSQDHGALCGTTAGQVRGARAAQRARQPGLSFHSRTPCWPIDLVSIYQLWRRLESI